jgi:hypothetical protein
MKHSHEEISSNNRTNKKIGLLTKGKGERSKIV